MITVRAASTSDILKINALLKQILLLHAEQRPDIFRRDREKYNLDEIAELVKNPNAPCLVAEANGECVGYALCQIRIIPDGTSMVTRKILYLDDLCVDESMRGNGIGKILTDAVISFAKELNADAVELNVWESNDGARRFYENYGFKTQRRYMELPLK